MESLSPSMPKGVPHIKDSRKEEKGGGLIGWFAKLGQDSDPRRQQDEARPTDGDSTPSFQHIRPALEPSASGSPIGGKAQSGGTPGVMGLRDAQLGKASDADKKARTKRPSMASNMSVQTGYSVSSKISSVSELDADGRRKDDGQALRVVSRAEMADARGQGRKQKTRSGSLASNSLMGPTTAAKKLVAQDRRKEADKWREASEAGTITTQQLVSTMNRSNEELRREITSLTRRHHQLSQQHQEVSIARHYARRAAARGAASHSTRQHQHAAVGRLA